ncbi:MAG: hypothetical protein JNL13_10910, partial [Chitinophagaceae bacterium]|nr:hypothetical protein [Chitinophagaceae bacterium]
MLLVLAAVFHASGQTTITVGTGTSTTTNNPIASCWDYSYTQQIYTAAEISAAGGAASLGVIAKLRFYFNSGAATNSDNWTIYIGHTSKTSFSSTSDWVAVSSLTNVFSGIVTFPAAKNWLEVPLSSYFTWDGTSNIVIAVDENKPGFYCSNNWTYTAKTNSSLYYRRDDIDIDPAAPPAGSRSANRANVQFVFQPLCSGTPVAGSTSVSSASVCAGASINLSLPTASAGAGIVYQWQSSPDNVTYTDISGATAMSYTTKPTTATWYRCKVSCVAAPASATSTPVQVTFVYNVSSVSNATRCGTGTADLTAAASSGTLKWYTAASGGTPIGSGSPFTTPLISSSTNFYVAAENNTTGSGVVGSGGSTSSASGSSPFSQYYESNHSQYLVLAGDLAAAGFGPGNMTALSMNITSKFSSLPFSDYTIKLAPTSATSLSGLLSPAFTSVYGPATYSSVSGANNFTFSTPFSWDGTSNILVDICFDNDPTADGDFFSSSDQVEVTAMPYTAVYGLYDDDAVLCGVSSAWSSASSSSLPVFVFTGNKVCSSPRVQARVTVNTAPAFTVSGTQTVCNNSVAVLKVTSPLANYTDYVWSPATGLYTDAAATIPYTSGSSAATVYAKSLPAGTQTYTCNALHTTTMCAAVASVKVTTLPASVSAIATPAYLCKSGTATIILSPPAAGFGAATLQWSVAADNISFTDIPSATAGSYTTPVLSATRYYRAAIRNGVGDLCLNTVSDTAQVLNPTVSSTTDGARCGPGTLDLAASGTDGTLKWYATSSGGTPLGSGTAFTTPSLTSSTTYYVAVEGAGAPGTVSVGEGANTTVSDGWSSDRVSPFDYYYGGFKKQYLVKAAELTAMGLTAGEITAVAFDVVSGGVLYEGFRLSIGTTAASVLGTTFLSGLTTVYTTTAPAGYTTPVSGLATFPFSVPLYWDGASNIVLETCWSNNDAGGTGTTVKYDGTSFVSSGYYRDDDETPDDLCSITTATTLSSRPKMVFNGYTSCLSARTAVTASINPPPLPVIDPSPGPVEICEGNTATLRGSGGGYYQWRNTAGRISGATAAAFTTGMAGSYQVIVTDAATGCKDSSAAVKINVNPSPTVSISPGGVLSICAESAQIYTGSFTGKGLTYQWFRSGTAIPGATDTFYA